MKRLISFICISAVLAAGLVQSVAAVETGSTLKPVPVYRKSMDEKETLGCLFFDDMPNVPYLSMELYYQTFMEGKMTVVRDGNGNYVYTEEQYGQTAIANADTDVIVIDDPSYFLATPVFKKEDSELLFGGPDEMVRVSATDIEVKPSALTIDLSQYGIDIREKNGALYYPFATLCDLFNNADCLTAAYSDGKIFFVSMYDEVNGGNAKSDDLGNLGWITEGDRPADMTELAYKELCLSTELFYGYPCDDNAFSEKMRRSGLDAALSELDPDTKAMLLSPDPGEYLAGVGRLFALDLCDGGHTGAALDSRLVDNICNLSVYSTYIKGLSKNLTELPYYYQKQSDIFSRTEQCRETRERIFGDVGYYSKGDTAYIIFDSFRIEYQGWRDYFSGASAEMPLDSVSVVYKGFIRAKNEGVKNIILDISANNGGDTIALQAICGMLCGEYSMRFVETLGGGVVRETFSTDRNLDGAIDELDDAVSYDDFNIAVLTSSASFSCANIMPFIMKEKGYPVIGEHTSGGSCLVLQRTTADGVDYCMSGYVRLTDSSGGDIDKGIPADIEIQVTQDDASALYDIETVGALVSKYYLDKKPAQQSEPSQTEDSSEESINSVSSDISRADSDSSGSAVDVYSSQSRAESSDVSIAASSSSVGSAEEALSAQESGQNGPSEGGTAIAVLVCVATGAVIVISTVIVILCEKKRSGRKR